MITVKSHMEANVKLKMKFPSLLKNRNEEQEPIRT